MMQLFEELLSSALKLTKRSESNLETLIVLLEGLDFDISKRGYALLFDDLKDLITAKEKEKIQKLHRVVKAVTRKVKDTTVLTKDSW